MSLSIVHVDGCIERPDCYMADNYELILEPLNLKDKGQRWVKAIHAHFCVNRGRKAAVSLGAINWAVSLFAESYEEVHVIDSSRSMLQRLQASVPMSQSPKIRYVQSDWTNGDMIAGPVDLVFADNSFTYLKFPEGWRDLLRRLHGRMPEQSLLLSRFFSLPKDYRRLTIDEIAKQYVGAELISSTEIRTQLLYSFWDAESFKIDTEKVLEEYEKNAGLFAAWLAEKGQGAPNDLESVKKYKNQGAIYYVPPIDDALELINEYYNILSVEYGPYSMKSHFPLVVAEPA